MRACLLVFSHCLFDWHFLYVFVSYFVYLSQPPPSLYISISRPLPISLFACPSDHLPGCPKILSVCFVLPCLVLSVSFSFPFSVTVCLSLLYIHIYIYISLSLSLSLSRSLVLSLALSFFLSFSLSLSFSLLPCFCLQVCV